MFCKLVFVASLAVGVFALFGDMNPYTSNTGKIIYKIATQCCKASKAEHKVPEVMASITGFAVCVTMEIDPDAFTRDIEEATRTESYDGIVKKYCAKSPQLKDCARGFYNGVAPCLPPGLVRTSEKSSFALIDFLCDNDGARAISLINNGPICVEEKGIDLNNCYDKMESDTRKLLKGYGGEDAYALMMAVEKEQCGIVDNGLSCFTNALKSCSNKTPAKLSQELHDILRDSMACAGVSIILQNGVLRLLLAMAFLHLLIGKFNNKC